MTQTRMLTALCILFAIAFSSCKKDDPIPQPGIAGYWIGKDNTSNSNVYPNRAMSALFNTDGTVNIYESTNSTLDTATAANKRYYVYTVTGNTVVCQNPNSSSDTKFTATINAALTFQEGIWEFYNPTQNVHYTAQYFLYKQ
jgi:outer membrane protein assembly factor BamE (lipoprotein component of BamABCDE complex)